MMLGPGKWANALRDAAAKEFAGQAVAGAEGQGDDKDAHRGRLEANPISVWEQHHTFRTSPAQLELLAHEIDHAASPPFCKRARLQHIAEKNTQPAP